MMKEDWLLFAKVAQYQSFSEAARRLSTPTTTVSRRIQQLESQLGERLFIRNTRSVTLTEFGQRLLPKTKLLEMALEELQSTIESHSQEISGKLKLSTSDTLSQFLLPSLISSFSSQHPLINFDISSSNRNEQLLNENIDFSFRIGQLEDSNLIAYKLCEIEYVLVAAPSFIEKSTIGITPETLIQHPCIIIDIDGKEVPWFVSSDDHVLELTTYKKYRVDNLFIAKSLAESGNGITLLPKFVAKEAIKTNTLVTVLDNVNIQKNPLSLIYFDKHFLSEKSKCFLKYIKEQRSHIESVINPTI
ncbi:LysR family transcriptional regulator [Aliivibrio fischeri]|uniref:Transcriptional regulator, LysR family n=1 Tax=Aliivibrio fischeri (strain ATCC 700601 / ES114) TaxID=312309 RepID=Q5DZ15_ALIF1|nr:LysR family transcriptional regulator [Aliivibrio fischeri]AAW87981.1 transcriptional regulator, LysR family [Aliivibrio fischeri ES114]MCE7536137.1 LysR family transcriptional regulator [Aliivibrio fischeri]MCE7558923.1 LysR family transcriptional regulator [Aliivibrio fischeri]MCE7565470.1 LysR family transcriptional regulator [Aliivibrio fischeri]